MEEQATLTRVGVSVDRTEVEGWGGSEAECVSWVDRSVIHCGTLQWRREA